MSQKFDFLLHGRTIERRFARKQMSQALVFYMCIILYNEKVKSYARANQLQSIWTKLSSSSLKKRATYVLT